MTDAELLDLWARRRDVLAFAHSLIAATREECEQDAKRYRWLRDNTYVEGYWIDGADGVDTKIRVCGSVNFLDDAIDKEIDA